MQVIPSQFDFLAKAFSIVYRQRFIDAANMFTDQSSNGVPKKEIDNNIKNSMSAIISEFLSHDDESNLDIFAFLISYDVLSQLDYRYINFTVSVKDMKNKTISEVSFRVNCDKSYPNIHRLEFLANNAQLPH